MTISVRIGVGAALLSAVLLSGCYHRTTWSKWERAFLEPLTLPAAEWSPDDLGTPPPPGDRERLGRFRPRVFIAPDGLPPVHFYEEYLPECVVRGQWRRVVDESPDRASLKRIERDRRYYLDYRGQPPCRGPACAEFAGTLFGRIFREEMQPPKSIGGTPRAVDVLKYSAVFSASGLPAGVSRFKELGADIVGDPDDWHELDIHGAVQLFFESGADEPFAVLLSQHNHMRTYLVGKDLAWPADDRLSICYAARSNEPYLCPDRAEPVRKRTIASPMSVRYLVLGGKPRLTEGEDLVYGPRAGATEVPVRLEQLPLWDPLYVSWIPLGDRKRILGFPSFSRVGPPGINMNTYPEVSRYHELAQLWYLADGDEQAVEIWEKSIRGWTDWEPGPVLEHNGRRFWTDWLNRGSAAEETAP